MSLAISFLYRLPLSSPSSPISTGGISNRTIGLYSQCRFLTGPAGRHDCYVELWTAPEGCDLDTRSAAVDALNANGELKENEEGSKWKDRMVCIATSHQLALTIPMSVNTRKGKSGAKM
jgi:hypothetical protein